MPFLSDIPVLGHLFRYDSLETSRRTELLIFLTPHVVRTARSMERIKQTEAARMHWCLADVHEIHGPTGLYQDTNGGCLVGDGEVVFPDTNPAGPRPGEFSPAARADGPVGPVAAARSSCRRRRAASGSAADARRSLP